jgi:hypothetical protein
MLAKKVEMEMGWERRCFIFRRAPFRPKPFARNLNILQRASGSGYTLQGLAPVRFRSVQLWALRSYPCPETSEPGSLR